ncbi:hypothetical protein VE01_02838 [Pseudogymnoascus verrucosus]|uniref:Aminoglycoside phosphotransferase domain-containing protein n=1 Tax=Pseudogymnoascus verrucosus TaxID=342668 RepID=A0A1B8GUX5_9PEZI|nr:uncharacterized protein VE01_02838 [Pseudogymnoascus verrucosus]OBT99623.1 hypothetical protein VE01_02838 [Pseudogymnoascus verrucosus]
MAATGKTVSLYTTLLAHKLHHPPPEEMTLELPQPSKEFLAQKDGSRGIFLIYDYYGFVKSGRKVHLKEKHALDLAAELNIPAPRVYEVSSAPDGIVSIRMDYIEGENLEELWPDMSEEDRQDICGQLREIISTMQSAEFKTGAIGSCGGGLFRELFSHGDLSQHNIIIKDMEIAGVIDWEYGGWAPEYWEYVKFFEV